MKIRIMSLAIALLAIGPMAYAVNSADSDVESIFLNAADDASGTEGMPVELDDIDMPKVVKNAIPSSTVITSKNTNGVTAALGAKGLDKETEQNIGELRKQNQDLQSHLNQLNQQMAMLRQAIEQSNKMFVASMAAQNAPPKFAVPKTQLQPANLIMEPTPSVVSALQTHPKITGSKVPSAASAPPPAIKNIPEDQTDTTEQQINLSETSVVNGQKEAVKINKSVDEKPADESTAHVLSMGDLLKDAHISNKLAVPASAAHSLMTSEEFDNKSASLILAGKKMLAGLTRLGLRYLPDDPNVMLKLSAGIFAGLFALLILAAWPTRRKMEKKEQKKIHKQQLLQQKEQHKQALREQKEQRALQLQQQKQQRLDMQLQKAAEQQRLREEKEQQRLEAKAAQEQARLAKIAEQEEIRLAKIAAQEQLQREKNIKREPEISKILAPIPLVEEPVIAVVRTQQPEVNSIKSEAGMRAMYNIASDSKESIPVKLNLARSCLENGDYEAVKQALRPVLVKGNKLQREEARIILEEAMIVLEQEG